MSQTPTNPTPEQNPGAAERATDASGTAAGVPGDAIPVDTLKKALHAFKKRLKLTKLDQESKLGHGPMSSGKKSTVQAIVPPREFPMAVWAELDRLGKVRHTGSGFFEFRADF